MKMKAVNVYADAVATPKDVAQLVLRLPYLAAIEVAAAFGGDVDKMSDGAKALIEAAQTAQPNE